MKLKLRIYKWNGSQYVEIVYDDFDHMTATEFGRIYLHYFDGRDSTVIAKDDYDFFGVSINQPEVN